MGVVSRLQLLRDLIDQPIIITSGVRCDAYNATLADADPNSSHLTGLAADFKVVGNGMRNDVLSFAPFLFKRYGIGEDYFHVDIDKNKQQGRTWLYPSKPKPYEEYPNIL